MLATLDGQRLQFVLYSVNQSLSSFSVTVGPLTQKNRYACTGLISVGAPSADVTAFAFYTLELRSEW